VFGNFSGLDPLHLPKAGPSPLAAVGVGTSPEDLRQELRKIILEELSAVLAA